MFHILVCILVMSHCIVIISPCMLVTSVCRFDIFHSIIVTSSYTAFFDGATHVTQFHVLQYASSLTLAAALLHAVVSTYALITLFCTAFVELSDIAVSIVGLLFRSL